MKRTTFVTALFLIVTTLLSFIILFCYFQEDLQLIVKETTYSIFTGCIFAIPSVLLMLILDWFRNSNTEYNTLYKLDKVLQQLADKINKDGISLEAIEEYENLVSDYGAKLNQITVDNFFFRKRHRACLDAVKNERFTITLTMHKIKRLLQAGTASQDEIGEKRDDLEDALERCLGDIKELMDLLR